MPLLHPGPHQGRAAKGSQRTGIDGGDLGGGGDARRRRLRPLSPGARNGRSRCPAIRIGVSAVAVDVRVKRIYEDAGPDDGYRVLVDRLWPRGVSREEARLDEWANELAPSHDLRRWFAHDPRSSRPFAPATAKNSPGRARDCVRCTVVRLRPRSRWSTPHATTSTTTPLCSPTPCVEYEGPFGTAWRLRRQSPSARMARISRVRRRPLGTWTSTTAPAARPMSARPTGESAETTFGADRS